MEDPEYTTDWGRWLEQPLTDSERWRGDESLSGGAGPWILHILPAPADPNCLGMFGVYAGIIFQKPVYVFIPSSPCFINTCFWKYDDVLIPLWPPVPHKTATTLMNDPFTIHWFRLISHDVAHVDLPCHQFVVLTHLRLRQWRCNRLCWCPACKESVVCGKWFAHWQCILCWQSPAAFTVWCINHVDRLTCYRCDTLRNNILKQLHYSQPDITWNWFASTLWEVQNLSCQKIKYCTKQMKRMHVRNANDHGKLDAQTSQAGFVQQQCYCKNIHLMNRSESQ